MAKNKLIKYLHSIKRTNIRYNDLKNQTFTYTGSVAPKSIRQLIVVIFQLIEIFKPPLF